MLTLMLLMPLAATSNCSESRPCPEKIESRCASAVQFDELEQPIAVFPLTLTHLALDFKLCNLRALYVVHIVVHMLY